MTGTLERPASRQEAGTETTTQWAALGRCPRSIIFAPDALLARQMARKVFGHCLVVLPVMGDRHRERLMVTRERRGLLRQIIDGDCIIVVPAEQVVVL